MYLHLLGGWEFLERVFRLFDLDRDNVLVQEDWVEFLKERLTLPISNKCGRRTAATRTDFIRVLIEQRCAGRAATTWNTAPPRFRIRKVELEEVNPHLRGGGVENNLGKAPPVHPTEIRTSISPSSAVELNTEATEAANY
uniref:EF-hand domain-containing protein n=1 Tax=Timema shepardi TaxID=629360 RepID=A0A7R9FX41_TIMSH|nr:unnamed protein product [Timema shepardi]